MATEPQFEDGPAAALAERRQVVRRAIRGLPDDMLPALIRGIERHGDELAPGRLFRSSGGGCAVGAMLRELDPEVYSTGGIRFWLRHGWRMRVDWYRKPLAAQPRLRHLEWSFDEAVGATRRLDARLSRGEAARRVGEWFAEDAREELSWRTLQRDIDRTEAPAARVPTPWQVPTP